jgi:hypothetical protein
MNDRTSSARNKGSPCRPKERRGYLTRRLRRCRGIVDMKPPDPIEEMLIAMSVWRS